MGGSSACGSAARRLRVLGGIVECDSVAEGERGVAGTRASVAGVNKRMLLKKFRDQRETLVERRKR